MDCALSIIPVGYVAHLQLLRFYDRLRTHWNPNYLTDRVFYEIRHSGSFEKMVVLHFVFIFVPAIDLMGKKGRILMEYFALLQRFFRYVIGVVINHLKIISQ